LNHLLGLYTPADWASNFPDHCAGDPHPATPEKGEALFKAAVAAMVAHLVAVKADTSARAVYREFGERRYQR